MDILTYNAVKDVGGRIRSFTAGEAITQGQILTAYQNQAFVNKRRVGTETIVSGSLSASYPSSSQVICQLSSTLCVYAWVSGGYLYIQATSVPANGSAPSVGTGAGGTIATPNIFGIYALSATTFLVVMPANSALEGVSAVIGTVTGTNVALGAPVNIVSFTQAWSMCHFTQVTSTTFILNAYGKSGSSSYGYMTQLLTVSGTTATWSTISFTGTCLAGLYTPGCAINATTLVVGSQIVTYTGGVLAYSASFTAPAGQLLSIAYLDSTHILAGFSNGICVGTLNAGYTTLTFGAFMPATITGTYAPLIAISSTQFMFGSYLITVNSNYALSVGPGIPPKGLWSVSSISTFSYIALSTTTLLLIRYANSLGALSIQLLTIAGDGPGGYANNLGIAMNSVSAGQSVSVLLSGSSASIYTALIAGQKYTNQDGTLVPAVYPLHQISLSYTQAASAATQVIPTFDLDNTEIYPYAIALSATEILILNPFTMQGVMNS